VTFGDLILKCKVCGTRDYVLAEVEEIDFCCFCGSREYKIKRLMWYVYGLQKGMLLVTKENGAKAEFVRLMLDTVEEMTVQNRVNNDMEAVKRLMWYVYGLQDAMRITGFAEYRFNSDTDGVFRLFKVMRTGELVEVKKQPKTTFAV